MNLFWAFTGLCLPACVYVCVFGGFLFHFSLYFQPSWIFDLLVDRFLQVDEQCIKMSISSRKARILSLIYTCVPRTPCFVVLSFSVLFELTINKSPVDFGIRKKHIWVRRIWKEKEERKRVAGRWEVMTILPKANLTLKF